MTIDQMAPSWPAALVLLPLAGTLLSVLAPRWAVVLGLLTAVATTLAALGLAGVVLEQGTQRVGIGGWGAPLGIQLLADGLSAMLLVMTALVGLAVSGHAIGYFREHQGQRQHFWSLWLLLWTALNAMLLSADLFNLYVALELVGLSAASLTALGGNTAAVTGAIRYLMVSLLGSAAYLLGVALLYHHTGTLDIALLAEHIDGTPVVRVALATMLVGLLLKTALFPFHVWLPPAHGSAPTPVSAILSALVVKATFYMTLRLWLDLFNGYGPLLGELLGVLGAAAVVWGSVLALAQTRLKLMIAYSTVAQLGYLFMAFPLAAAGGAVVWTGALYLALAHGLAKAAMFMTAGSLQQYGEHDRIAELDRAVQRLPLTLTAFTLAGVSIMGLPPSGGFIGKWLLLEAAFSQDRYVLAAVMLLGGVLAAAYVFKVVGYAFTPAETAHETHGVPAVMQWSPLLLAAGAILLGLTLPLVEPLLQVGTAFDVLDAGTEAP